MTAGKTQVTSAISRRKPSNYPIQEWAFSIRMSVHLLLAIQPRSPLPGSESAVSRRRFLLSELKRKDAGNSVFDWKQRCIEIKHVCESCLLGGGGHSNYQGIRDCLPDMNRCVTNVIDPTHR